ncbi:MAG: glutathione peroxidase [Bacteroidia bacterium]
MKNVLLALLSLLPFGCGSSDAAKVTEVKGKPIQDVSVYDFTMKNIEGKDVNLADYKGKVLIFVNVASKCGLTPQYKELQAFYDQYHAKGVEILGFPANNFLSQEPGSDSEIQSFCSKNYGVSFPMFSKISVKGSDMHPLYQYLTGTTQESVSWNFQKFLVNKEGKVVRSVSPKTGIQDAEIVKAIEALL